MKNRVSIDIGIGISPLSSRLSIILL